MLLGGAKVEIGEIQANIRAFMEQTEEPHAKHLILAVLKGLN